jgi:RNA polymerase sigma factor (sigma-70 family)
MPIAEEPGVFPTTQWSIVLAARQANSPAAQEALERLCRAYWFPLYVYIGSKEFSPADAEDLTQEFLARFLESGGLRAVQQKGGRFRAYLLACLNHFLSNERDRSRAQKRGGTHTFFSLDALTAEERLRLEPIDPSAAPETLYDRHWARALLDNAFDRLRLEMITAGKGAIFELLHGQLSANTPVPYPKLAVDLGVSEGAVRKMVQRLRERYRELVREEVSQTVVSPAEAEGELRYLLDLFRRD